MSNLPPPPSPPPPPVPNVPPPPSGYPDARSARADARAAKAHAKALRPWYRKKRWWVLGTLVVIVGIVAATSAGGDDQPTATQSAAAGGESAGGQDVYAIGQTAHTGDFDVTVHTVEDPYVSTNQFVQPAQDRRFVAVEVAVTNTGDESLPMSTLLGAEVTDSLSRPWNSTLTGLDRPQLDGTVAAGESRRGWIVFEVADDATDLRLRIKGNLTATGSLFALS